jgi:hypothetical protein
MESLPPYVLQLILGWLPSIFAVRALMTCKTLYRRDYVFHDPVGYYRLTYIAGRPEDHMRIMRGNHGFTRVYLRVDADDVWEGIPDGVNDLRIDNPVTDSIADMNGINFIKAPSLVDFPPNLLELRVQEVRDLIIKSYLLRVLIIEETVDWLDLSGVPNLIELSIDSKTALNFTHLRRVRRITLGKNYNWPSEFPNSVTHLQLGAKYNQPTVFHFGLQVLSFGYEYSQEISLPRTIREVHFGHGCRKNVDLRDCPLLWRLTYVICDSRYHQHNGPAYSEVATYRLPAGSQIVFDVVEITH